MFKFILVVLYTTYGSNMGISFQEFNSAAACEAARDTIVKARNAGHARYGDMAFACVAK